MGITLAVSGGPHKGKSFTFVGHDTFIVGRSPKSHFRLSEEDRYFSRIHFLIEANPPRCRLLDMNSRNGTFVNGERVENCELRDGDKIQAGRTVIRVSFHETAIAPAPTPPPAIVPIVELEEVEALDEVEAVDEVEVVPPVPTATVPRRASRETAIPAPAACLACGEPAVPDPKDNLALCAVCRQKSRRRRSR